MAMRFNGENYRGATGLRRSGPLPHDDIHWHDRPQRKVTLPVLRCLADDPQAVGSNNLKVKTAGDLARQESERIRQELDNPPLPGRFAVDPATAPNVVRAIGSITVKLGRESGTHPPGQGSVKVKARTRRLSHRPSRWFPDTKAAAAAKRATTKKNSKSCQQRPRLKRT